MVNYIERATIQSSTPFQTAQLFQAVLAADRGFTSTLRRRGADVLVIASDGQAVRFSVRAATHQSVTNTTSM